MNTILSVALLVVILMMAWVFQTGVEKILNALQSSKPSASQNEWRGNRVRATNHILKK